MKTRIGTGLTLLVGLLSCTCGGCGEPNLAQESPTYKQLPPGEGQRRLQETLAKRNGQKPPTVPSTEVKSPAGGP